jgi:hypothetical protein
MGSRIFTISDFDIDKINTNIVEFGVSDYENTHTLIPIDPEIKEILVDILKWTIKYMIDSCEENYGELYYNQYEPSNKYGAIEPIYLPFDSLPYALVNLYNSPSFHINPRVLEDPGNIFYYFARFKDNRNKRLTAIRRATQFKGILKCKWRIIRLLDDSLKFVKDDIFKLNNDFDMIIDESRANILRPSGFESIADMKDTILAAVPSNIKKLQNSIRFISFESIETYASEHPRAARYLASILAQEDLSRIDMEALKKLCENTSVAITISTKNNEIIINEGNEMAFLEVLDRRRYLIELVDGQPEPFKAMNRTRI